MESTIKQFYHSNELGASTRQDLFMELEDKIRIHYRDLQIELNRKEFENFAGTFKVQADRLLKIIEKTNYKDGAHPSDITVERKVWTQSKLEQEVAYNPKRVSLEECADGYHLHYRNCTIQLDEKGFKALKQAFASTDSATPVASNFDELLELIKVNRIRHWLPIGKRKVGNGKHRISVAKQDISRISAVLTGIGMEGRLMPEGTTYSKKGLAIELIIAKDPTPKPAVNTP